MDFQNEKIQAEAKVFSINPTWIPRWKRILDVSFVLLTLPLVVPLAAAIAALIRIVSEGPVLFKQERIGFLGQRFMCFKFRTMYVGADATVHQGHFHQLMDSNTPMTKMDSQGDSRIIPFGRLLRSSGLDELPQLLNVLRGEMSIVGPRPCLSYEYDKYLPWQRERFSTLPGLTGLWQVSGKNRTTFVEMIQLDIEYSRTKSVSQDLRILLRTIPALAVQVCETRRRKEISSSSVPSKTVLRGHRVVQPYSLRQSAIAGIVRVERHGRVKAEGLKPKL